MQRLAHHVVVLRHSAELPQPLLELARAQAGVLSRAQLLTGSLSTRQIGRASVHWRRLARGVYWVTPTFEQPGLHTLVWAGVLAGGDDARAGGLSAARLDGLAEPQLIWSAVNPVCGEDVVIFVPRPRHPRPQPGFAFVRERAGERLASRAAEPPRTRIEDTVIDLCAADRAPDELLSWLTRACQRRLTTPSRLLRRLEHRHRIPGRDVIAEILHDVALGVTSNLEHRALREVLTPHCLPAFELQAPNNRRQRVDVLFRRYRVIVELDGRIGHVGEGAFRDMMRDNAHIVSGYATLRFGWNDVVTRPCAVAAQIGQLLKLAGWDGEITPCRHCRSGSSTG